MSYGRYAHDDDSETASLRKRLRQAGIPVGQFGDSRLLRRVAQQHGIDVGDGMAGMAGDAAASIRRMFPGMKLPADGGSFGIQAQPEPRRYVRGGNRMAFESARRQDPTLSIKTITGLDLGRIKVVGG